LLHAKRVRIHGLHEVVPQAAAIVSLSCGTPPVKMGPHAMTCTFYLIKRFDRRFNLNHSTQVLLFEFYIFLGYISNLEE
jgi:hypothetical protein